MRYCTSAALSAAGILLGAALVAAPFSTALAGAYKSFGKWEVSCTNGRNCELRFFDRDNKAGANAFVVRDAGPSTPAFLQFTIPGDVFGEEAKDLTLAISVDGGAEQTFGRDKLSYDDTDAAWRITSDLAASGLLDTLRKGKVIALTASADGQTVKASIPLEGMAASLLFLDDTQNRVGHIDALVSKGDKPPSPLPAMTDIRSFADLPEAIRSNFTDDNATCGGVEEDTLAGLGGFVRRYTDKEALYVVPCGSPGAYNVPFVIYYRLETMWEQVQFPVMAKEGPSVSTTGYNLDYDEKSDTMTSFFKGRGLGDCGSFYKWKISEGGSGRALVLMQETDKGDCNGKYGNGPESWPQTWPVGQKAKPPR
ncbi:DUF1176 domain-containing protein [Rhizobium sp. C1]|uniref:DUF1176 domain-containing protein n=1 Tax=Rhizobium sp. C1 TaxID=1349799 RepID=UPI001E3E4885|nr:DUF1176 domain-containing protein [Rhizobium sp. C1]MCD2179871.1 DUF1176 domain-containing protein [Rhizobium sp. C1]